MQRGQCFHGQVGVNGFGAVTGKHSKVMNFAGSAGLDHQTSRSAQARGDQVLVDAGERQQCGHGHLGGVHAPVADDQDVVAALDGVHCFGAQRCQLGFHAFATPQSGVSDVQSRTLELSLGGLLDVAQLGHVGEVQDRLAHFEAHRRVDLVDVQQVRLGADEGHQRHHDRFADRVNRGVGHLREQLLEVVVQRLVFVGQNGQWAVVAHGANGFFTGRGHGGQQELDVFLCGAKGLLQVEQGHIRSGGQRGRGDVVQLDAQVFDPLLVRFGAGQTGLQLFVVDHAALFQIDQEHLARLQTPLAHDLAFGDRQYAGFRTHDDHVVVGDDVT